MSMKAWRYHILCGLLDFEHENGRIHASLPRMSVTPPTLALGSVYKEPITYKHFDQLITNGDIVEVGRMTIQGFTFIDYKITDTGKAALQALPNFDKRQRVNEPRKLTLA